MLGPGVASLEERYGASVREALQALAGPEQEVTYTLQLGEATMGCENEGCGEGFHGHEVLAMRIFVCVDDPQVRLATSVTLPLNAAMEPGAVKEATLDLWNEMTFGVTALHLRDLDDELDALAEQHDRTEGD